MIDPTTTAFVFPGQGSQAVGMGKALAEQYPIAKQTFDEANDLLGYDLAHLCFEGPADVLNDTAHAQPALYVAGIAALRVVYEAWRTDFTPAYVAGHSLGEFTALTAAGVLSFQDGLALVQERGDLMRDAGDHSPGGMAALLGPTVEQVEALVGAVDGVLVIANDNCPGQVVVSGETDAVERAVEQASAFGAKRAIPLNVSVATHSPLMARAQADFDAALDATTMNAPRLTVYGNTTAAPLDTVEAIREELRQQLTSTVRWRETMNAMLAAGMTHMIEIGSKNVLSGLLKRIDRKATRIVVDSPDGVTALNEA